MPLDTTHDIQSLRQQARQLREQHRYAEALPLYEAIWTGHRDAADEWDGWGLAYCLNKTKAYQQALEVSRALYTAWPDFSSGKMQYAWAVYHTTLKVKDPVPDAAVFMKAARAIMTLNTQEDQFGPYVRTVFRVLEHLKTKEGTTPEEMMLWCDKLDPALLSDKPGEYKTPDGKFRSSPSDLEAYYACRLKLLDAMGRHEELLQTMPAAKGAVQKFHYDNDVWFGRYEARALAGLGRIPEAVEVMHIALAKRREWYILYELAIYHKQLEQPEQALERAAQACLAVARAPEYGIQLFGFMADMLQEHGKQDEARQHARLVLAIRREKRWKIGESLLVWAARYGADGATAASSAELLRVLRPSWQTWSGDQGKRRKGTVKTLFPDGHAGFIADEQGKSYYFRVSDIRGKDPAVKLEKGQMATFDLVEGYNKKHNRAEMSAKNIKLIDKHPDGKK